MDLVTQLPLRGKGFDMDYRIRFVINIMKQEATGILCPYPSLQFRIDIDTLQVLSIEEHVSISL